MSSYIGYNITEKDKARPARKRFTDAASVYAVYDELKIQDQPDAARRAKIRNAVEGGLPYSSEQLRSKGLAFMTNLNFHALKGMFDARAEAILKLNTDTCDLIELVPRTDGPVGPDDNRIATVVAEELSAQIRAGGHTIPAIATANREADMYGIGPITWRDDVSFEPIALERGQLKFRSDGPVNSDDHDLFMFESQLPASYLFSLLDNEKFAAGLGWDMQVLKELVVAVFSHGTDIRNDPSSIDGLSPIESSILRYRTNAFYESHQFDTFDVLHVYVREMAAPRGVTHIIVPGSSVNVKKFLFYRENAYETMGQCLTWLAYSPAERYARSVRGLATSLVPIEKTADRLTCAIIDSAFRATKVTLQQATPGSNPAVSMTENGNTSIIAAGLDPVPNANAAANLQALTTVRQFVSQIGAGSVAGTDLAPVSTGVKVQEGGTQMSKAEAEIQERRRTQKDENLFNQRVPFTDRVFAEAFRRFMNIVNGPKRVRDEYGLVTTFVENCHRRGVTDEMLREIPERFTVVTCRDLLLGANGKYTALSEMLQVVGGNLDEAGRKAATHDMFRLRFGRKAADRYCPMESRDSSPSDQASFATLENTMIRELKPVLVGPDQRHWSHIPVHTQVLQEVQQAVQQGLAEAQTRSQRGEDVQGDQNGNLAPVVDDPTTLASILEAASTHIQEHLAIGGLQLGMKPAAEQVKKMLRSLDDTVKALNLAIATQRRVKEAEEEKRQRELEDLQRRASEAEMQKALAKVQADKEVGMARVQADHEVDMARVELDRQLNSGKLQAEREHRIGQLGLESEAARARAANEAAVARAGIENRRAESEATIEGARRRQGVDEELARRQQAASEMANVVASRQRFDNVIGRETVSPSQIVENPTPAAPFGELPL